MMTTTLEVRREMGAGPLTSRFDEALQFTSSYHRQQMRKGSRVPDLSHLMSASALVLEHGGSEDQAIASLLHDALEDASVGEGPAVLKSNRERVGETVPRIDEACSDGLDADGNRSGTWTERTRPYAAGLRDPQEKPDDTLLVTAAGKIHNRRCITADLRTYGPAFWTCSPAGSQSGQPPHVLADAGDGPATSPACSRPRKASTLLIEYDSLLIRIDWRTTG